MIMLMANGVETLFEDSLIEKKQSLQKDKTYQKIYANKQLSSVVWKYIFFHNWKLF